MADIVGFRTTGCLCLRFQTDCANGSKRFADAVKSGVQIPEEKGSCSNAEVIKKEHRAHRVLFYLIHFNVLSRIR